MVDFGSINAAFSSIKFIKDSLTQMIDFQAEKEELRQRRKEKEDWKNRKSKYKLVTTSGGAIVPQSIEDHIHYACPSCMNKSTIEILQNKRDNLGNFECPSCKVSYPIKPPKPRVPPVRRVSHSRWMERIQF